MMRQVAVVATLPGNRCEGVLIRWRSTNSIQEGVGFDQRF
jgi:hypothetical protein